MSGIATPFPLITKSYDSGNQAITAAGLLTLAHGLGVKPKLIMCYLVCTSAELNYSVNDEMLLQNWMANTGASGRGLSLVADATNISIRIGSNTNVFQDIINKTTGASGTPVNANWRILIRAYA